MITYPILKKGATIGVTAPSSGVPEELHHIVERAVSRLNAEGYEVICSEIVWTDVKTRSASAKKRAEDFQRMMEDENIDLIIPPWGGELLIETLEHIDFEKIHPKWVMGYSDTSMLLLAITLKTGIATAHGTNLVDLRGEYSDKTTAMWRNVLATQKGNSIVQYSSEKFQKEWHHENPSPMIFHLTEETSWKSVAGGSVTMSGRLLGGCIDIVRHMIGTPFGDVKTFRSSFTDGEPIIWYFENCNMKTTDLRRTLVQMKLAGWFDGCAGIMFGRSPANTPVDDYLIEDVYQDLYGDIKVPVLYDIDCGHIPPQITLINGSFAEVEVEDGKGIVKQTFI
ncbi:muramoyltetrapeptide carboxypeptidase LdcA involved in peptidoglycan recycling [Bacillus tianshenii]|uniref:Muramoyltetrapeptide carboxypeptidase LdcA involved in peptidoglycan recycling n=1 Tax=Sutcliffiella tianshenii TaxID=1463404 RepID=A0ABS2P2H3_9BACI|nr:S66 peptidase family protein [Bacillus tianshenii]MBM7621147.1 muramoyltetrapeptide carboxypeptidase LdcA involved in peptidoglycan recycling [Bacillus tianshenii]